MLIDRVNEFGMRVDRRMHDERIVWLTTVRADGMPQPVPVWYLWDGGSKVIIFTQPGSQKVRNILNNSNVALHLDGDGRGGDIVIFWGHAEILQEAVPELLEDYVSKYEEGFKRIDTTREEFERDYSTVIMVQLTHLSGH